jgi:glycosyltransferase involved in cell wall biosynthesis
MTSSNRSEGGTNQFMRVAFLATDNREHFKDYKHRLPYFGTAPEALLEGFTLLPKDIEVHVISCLQKPPKRSPAKLADNIYYHALHVPNIGWMKTGYQGCMRAVRRKLKDIRPHIVHGQGTERDCALSAVFSGFPNVLTIHGVMRAIFEVTHSRRFSYYWFAKHLETLALCRTQGVITISPYVDALVSPYSKQTWFIPNALKLFFFDSRTNQLRRPGPARLVNVGVISHRKRQVELLEHLLRLRREVPFEFTFVGKAAPGNPYAERFQKLLQVANATYGSFKHREYLPDEAFRDLYDDSDAMIHFSTEESFGLTFAEALARNLTLFASDVGAIRQISQGIPSCLILGVDDFPGLVGSLKQWIDSAAYDQLRGDPPNNIISSRYHPKVVAAQHLQVYNETLQNINGRRS